MHPLQAGPDPNDPLVNPPHAGINGWFTRIGGLFSRSWKSMAAIFAITRLIPTILLTIIAAVAAVAILGTLTPTARLEFDEEAFVASLPLIVAGVLVLVVLLIYTQMVGYAAATYAVTRQAAGYEARLGESAALRAPARLGSARLAVRGGPADPGGIPRVHPARLLRLRRHGSGRPDLSVRAPQSDRQDVSIFNNNLGRVLGRLALLLVATLIANGVTTVFDQVGNTVAGNTGELAVIIAASAISGVLGIIIELPLTMLTFSGILLTYTEQRGWEGPATARTLADELANRPQQLALAG